MTSQDLNRVRTAFAELTELHDWSSYQTPRNMTLALTAHVGAVAAHLQFVPEGRLDEDSVTEELRGEVADCLVYLMALSDALGMDLIDDAAVRISAAVAAGRRSED